ncbi:c-type cytochrome [Acidiphilium sp. AL]|uniref:C-type cytochrome n=2 Tax=Acidiphilium iwatense TaxID=768198 RepID=A0ABS9E1K2_9PROT|nr:c-type cytochrome [Acidiphilium sp. AL]MCF3948887.1 c-type cytochrome [Acidiphilium iwatense]MCU4159810.1 c-type cytochrome [Acidiphilium sp. AL]
MKARYNIIGASVIGVAAAGLIAVAGFAADTSSGGAMPKGETIAKGSDCFSCHAINQKIVGPAFTSVAAKFAGKKGAETTLVNAVKKGHVGTWGKVPMPPHPQLSDAKIKEIISWILSLKKTKTAAAEAASGKTYSYTVKGKTLSTSFPIYQAGTKKVTPEVFRGYELFNSYCFRCHGEDAVGGSYAPNLRRSLANGMKESKFVSIAMTGVKSKGMPSWAGFFSPHQIHAIYQYTKARSVAVVGTGTPKH